MSVINDDGVLVDSEGVPLSLTAEYQISDMPYHYKITSIRYDGGLRVEFQSQRPPYLQEEHHFITLPRDWMKRVRRWEEPTLGEIAEDVFTDLDDCEKVIAPKVEELLRAMCLYYDAEEILMRDVSNCSFIRRDPLNPIVSPEIEHASILSKLRARGVLPYYFDLLDRRSE